ncbi:MAG: hypothetical protein B7Y07_01840 [Halothiobacillus sp. 24-54-40]|jgi:hypothetical protein|nr:hypothetical protein [Halothiobacillaceae bacterium]OYV46776.1 MAG: hypothetical protein B7X12_03680 [Halothiobacillus sp. 20-53-49]OYZ88075.1 MAG: hypothetical protein B7Y07_01840 [Halothiobacillus sp. 24-54-40]OZA81538.1 MAG: hypothetical protein B7X64_00875 [Halothiobacillus sp. 39-53-45]HQS29540.1 hypothetical protein [Halothiobacillus sp.]
MNKSKTCWICGAEASTGEHMQKKTDVTAMFGTGTFEKVVKYDYDKKMKIPIQGPGAAALKYDKNLCGNCNNARTQPFDRAYAKFCDHVRDNFSALQRTLTLNTNLIFRKDKARKERRNLFLYFVKAFGCQLNDKNIVIPQVLREALLGKNYDSSFRVSICLNQFPLSFMQNFPLEGNQDQQGLPVDFFWAQDNGWFTAVLAYKRPIPVEFGEEWFGKTPSFRVGRWTGSNHEFPPTSGTLRAHAAG